MKVIKYFDKLVEFYYDELNHYYNEMNEDQKKEYVNKRIKNCRSFMLDDTYNEFRQAVYTTQDRVYVY